MTNGAAAATERRHEEDPRPARQPRPHWVGDGFQCARCSRTTTGTRPPAPSCCWTTPARRISSRPGVRAAWASTASRLRDRDHRLQRRGRAPRLRRQWRRHRSGDVQWMTAASGIVHEEFHSDAFTRQGGELEMVQLWVNLPAKDKMGPAGYQGILAADIPSVDLPDGAGTLRVIAGSYASHRGAGAHPYADGCLGRAVGGRQVGALSDRIGPQQHAGGAARHAVGERRVGGARCAAGAVLAGRRGYYCRSQQRRRLSGAVGRADRRACGGVTARS